MRYLAFALGLLTITGSASSQPRPSLTAADYARAEKFLGYHVNPLVLNAGVQ